MEKIHYIYYYQRVMYDISNTNVGNFETILRQHSIISYFLELELNVYIT